MVRGKKVYEFLYNKIEKSFGLIFGRSGSASVAMAIMAEVAVMVAVVVAVAHSWTDPTKVKGKQDPTRHRQQQWFLMQISINFYHFLTSGSQKCPFLSYCNFSYDNVKVWGSFKLLRTLKDISKV